MSSLRRAGVAEQAEGAGAQQRQGRRLGDAGDGDGPRGGGDRRLGDHVALARDKLITGQGGDGDLRHLP